eukprot:14478-Prymnesium_polylepis.1
MGWGMELLQHVIFGNFALEGAPYLDGTSLVPSDENSCWPRSRGHLAQWDHIARSQDFGTVFSRGLILGAGGGGL